MTENTCIVCGEVTPEGLHICTKCDLAGVEACTRTEAEYQKVKSDMEQLINWNVELMSENLGLRAKLRKRDAQLAAAVADIEPSCGSCMSGDFCTAMMNVGAATYICKATKSHWHWHGL